MSFDFDRLKDIFAQSQIGIFFYNKEGQITALNNRFVEILSSSHQKLIGAKLLELPNKQIVEATQKSLKIGYAEYYNWYEATTSEKRVFVKVIFIGLKDSNNIYQSGIGWVEDYTEQKEKDKRIENLASIFANSMNDIFLIDKKSLEIIDISKSVVKNTGYDFLELKGKNILDIIHKSDHLNFEKIVQQNDFNSILTFIKKDGSNFSSETFSHQIENNYNLIALYCINTTEKQKIQQRLKESEILQNTLIENIPNAVTLKDNQLRWLLANKNALNLFGLENVNYFKKSNTELSALAKPQLTKILLDCNISDKEAIDTRKTITYTKKIEISNNEIRIFEISKIPILDIVGSNHSVLVIFNDITDRIKMIEEVVEAKIYADNANKMKTRFIATISHEIRNQLNGIIGITDILKDEVLSQTTRQYIDLISKSALNINNIINDLLDLSKIEADKLNINYENVDLLAILKEIIEIHVPLALNKKNELIFDFHPKIPTIIETDSLRLKQVITNILNNAIKFTEKGQVELNVDFEQISENKGKFFFKIKDTGIGIAEEKQKSIFTPFSQADASISSKFGGTGLGLAISKSIVIKMNGNIHLFSKQNIGSEFIIDFLFTFSKKNIDFFSKFKNAVIIDRNQRFCQIISSYLTSFSIPNYFTDNFLEILNTNSQKFDLFIVEDFLLTTEIINFVKEKKSILICSTYSNKSNMKNQDIIFIKKPVDYVTLIQTLNNAEELQPQEHSQPNEDLVLEKKKILIVEDNSLNLTLTKLLINKLLPNTIIFDASNGREALEIIENNKFHLIFMDIQMPVLNGLEATKIIRETELKKQQHTPIIALTAAVLPEESTKCFDVGMDGFLTKPIDIDKLKGILKKYL